jgi:hypothetical protein
MSGNQGKNTNMQCNLWYKENTGNTRLKINCFYFPFSCIVHVLYMYRPWMSKEPDISMHCFHSVNGGTIRRSKCIKWVWIGCNATYFYRHVQLLWRYTRCGQMMMQKSEGAWMLCCSKFSCLFTFRGCTLNIFRRYFYPWSRKTLFRQRLWKWDDWFS